MVSRKKKIHGWAQRLPKAHRKRPTWTGQLRVLPALWWPETAIAKSSSWPWLQRSGWRSRWLCNEALCVCLRHQLLLRALPHQRSLRKAFQLHECGEKETKPEENRHNCSSFQKVQNELPILCFIIMMEVEGQTGLRSWDSQHCRSVPSICLQASKKKPAVIHVTF